MKYLTEDLPLGKYSYFIRDGSVVAGFHHTVYDSVSWPALLYVPAEIPLHASTYSSGFAKKQKIKKQMSKSLNVSSANNQLCLSAARV